MTVTLDVDRFQAAVFDMDGVVTDTASVHADAWKRTFDDFLSHRDPRVGEDHRLFTAEDYLRYVDGKPREDGVSAFLVSRGITLPWGEPGDTAGVESVHGLGNRKNLRFLESLRAGRVSVFESTVDLVHRLQRKAVRTAVLSASRNCAAVLEAAGLADLFAVRVDGEVLGRLGLPGKPDPAMMLEAARRLGVDPSETVVVEDALAGVEAARGGGFGLVLGVDRAGQADELRMRGADVVVGDLGEVELVGGARRRLSSVPDASDAVLRRLLAPLPERPLAVFLDFDGTLSPIVDDPAAARLVEGAAAVLGRLASRCPVTVISGRDLPDVVRRVGLPGVWYAGSHGLDLAGPDGQRHEVPGALQALPALDAAEEELRARLGSVPGAIVERKRFALTAHYRMVAPGRSHEVVSAAEDLAQRFTELRASRARCAVELRPVLAWDKGRALMWLLEQVSPRGGRTPVFAGDDLTDEDALAVVRESGIGVVVRSAELGDRLTAAHVAVDSPSELVALLDGLCDRLPHDDGTGD